MSTDQPDQSRWREDETDPGQRDQTHAGRNPTEETFREPATPAPHREAASVTSEERRAAAPRRRWSIGRAVLMVIGVILALAIIGFAGFGGIYAATVLLDRWFDPTTEQAVAQQQTASQQSAVSPASAQQQTEAVPQPLVVQLTLPERTEQVQVTEREPQRITPVPAIEYVTPPAQARQTVAAYDAERPFIPKYIDLNASEARKIYFPHRYQDAYGRYHATYLAIPEQEPPAHWYRAVGEPDDSVDAAPQSSPLPDTAPPAEPNDAVEEEPLSEPDQATDQAT